MGGEQDDVAGGRGGVAVLLVLDRVAVLDRRGGDERRRAVELRGRLRAGRRLEPRERLRPEHAEPPRVGQVVVRRPARELEQGVQRRPVDRAPGRRPCGCGGSGSARGGPRRLTVSSAPCPRVVSPSSGAGPSSRWRASASSALRVDGRGAGGDRTHAVLHEHKGEWKPLTAREAPRLLAWQRGVPVQRRRRARPGARRRSRSSPRPTAARYRWGDPRLRRALGEDLGRAGASCAATSPGIQDLARTLLVTARGDAGRARRRARRRRSTCAASAPTCTSTSTCRPGPSSAGRAASWSSPAACGCGCCTRASAARSPPATPTRRSSGRSCCATSHADARARCSGSTRA